ncbi:hypothetical protein TREMEDRAFT_65239 [Tremella mesenterica DSM 1558]|uniref:uncharacterized protein n=1 Tax=Tremella mesenterica (strain ATCC 24925 / CBS 8224 / DSM 1558 / NBRC 9311 / NRRL Y-6157 / RJB 2259-6 / UBC 559-6) TaxID=578456 RepID=UPI00032CE154|nr:uncharacterized protein TREMEDRAFT_65239 [Tremella mesenterica DSM 1558]EIW66835.1 hypothetical protein TREMEDRAFT_65239 [Tremella mesenterica DSM 1558]
MPYLCLPTSYYDILRDAPEVARLCRRCSCCENKRLRDYALAGIRTEELETRELLGTYALQAWELSTDILNDTWSLCLIGMRAEGQTTLRWHSPPAKFTMRRTTFRGVVTWRPVKPHGGFWATTSPTRTPVWNASRSTSPAATPSSMGRLELIDSAVSEGQSTYVFINGKAGRGKTYLVAALLDKFRSEGRIPLVGASSAFAAVLYEGGTTIHSLFKVPVNERNEELESMVRLGTARADLIREACCLFWDEAPMANSSTGMCGRPPPSAGGSTPAFWWETIYPVG